MRVYGSGLIALALQRPCPRLLAAARGAAWPHPAPVRRPTRVAMYEGEGWKGEIKERELTIRGASPEEEAAFFTIVVVNFCRTKLVDFWDHTFSDGRAAMGSP